MCARRPRTWHSAAAWCGRRTLLTSARDVQRSICVDQSWVVVSVLKPKQRADVPEVTGVPRGQLIGLNSGFVTSGRLISHRSTLHEPPPIGSMTLTSMIMMLCLAALGGADAVPTTSIHYSLQHSTARAHALGRFWASVSTHPLLKPACGGPAEGEPRRSPITPPRVGKCQDGASPQGFAAGWVPRVL